jgi:hypothetical protein
VDTGDDYSDDDGDDADFQPPHPGMRHSEPQPSVDNPRFEGRGGHDNQQRFRDRDRPDRQGRGPDQQRGYVQPRQQNAEVGAEPAGGQPPSAEGQSRRRERFTPTHEQPEFLRRPVRRPRRDTGNGAEASGVAEETEQD